MRLIARNVIRHKKCDEGKPHCQRCVSSGETCSYEYTEHPNTTKPHLVPRTKPAPRPPSELLARGSRDTETALEPIAPPPSVSSASGASAVPTNFSTSATQGNKLNHNWNLTVSSGCTPNALARSATPSFLDPPLGYINPSRITSSLTLVIEIPHGVVTYTSAAGTGVEGPSQLGDDEPEDNEHSDPEGIQALLCPTPTMDRNVKENALPFVLQCYSQWAIVAIFEPLKIVHVLREQVIKYFSSEDTRTRTILMANVMNIYVKNLSINDVGMSIITHLDSQVRENVKSFMGTPPLVSETDRQNAMYILDSTLEILILQLDTRSLAVCIQSVDNVAAVFRRACPEPPGQPLNLANMVLEPGLNLRHFVSADIVSSITTARPTHFKYQVPFSAELCEQMFQIEENYGLQCFHGLPDQFILIFAWINSLCEIPGAGIDVQLITWIETEIHQVKLVLDQSEDPALKVGRMVVREGWRNAVLIYLYM
ncbi:hypothetical protein FRC11_004552, partial [Ceratobasidium sp. 423]